MHMLSIRTFPLIAILSVVAMGGCTSVQVDPLVSAPHLMCIKHNPKVMVSDFVPVLQQGFSRHGIDTRLYEGAIPRAECSYLVTYSARRSWDFMPYLSQADIQILGPDRRKLASAEYHLRAKGGFSMMKWQGTETKMRPVIDQLLAGVEVAPKSPVAEAETPASNTSLSYEERLSMLEKEQLPYEEYMRRFKALNQEFGR